MRSDPLHVGRDLDADVGGAEDVARGLLQDEAHAPGHEQRVLGAPVEAADDELLEDEAERRRDDEGRDDGHGHVGAEGGGREVAEGVLHHVGRVGADHDELAVRHVDDAHEAEGDGQADGGQKQDGAQADAVEHLHDHCFHVTPPSCSGPPPSRSP